MHYAPGRSWAKNSNASFVCVSSFVRELPVKTTGIPIYTQKALRTLFPNKFGFENGMEIDTKNNIKDGSVYQLLQEAESKNSKSKRSKSHQVNLATISYEARKYLEKTPCKYQNAEVIENFLREVASFNLTKAEKLQLLNIRPETPVEIQLIIEESEERLKTESEIQELLDIIAKLPSEGKEDVTDEDNLNQACEEGNDVEMENE